MKPRYTRRLTHYRSIPNTFVVLCALIALASAGALREKRSGWSGGWSGSSGGWSGGYGGGISIPSTRVVAVNKVVNVNKVVEVPQVVSVRKVVSVPQVVTVNKVIAEPSYSVGSYGGGYGGGYSSGWNTGSSGWW
ncbi:hypothetical protein K1T71_008513 [Dendrolimus kikuchii]|uniref:Uncharacterized protein n=1 Tax=Dendrolimus kikuchii TaxID=765133 RepID=A0ACC1CX82_9NEOP|nr:hypothetical protein K1T71_008513 [Dendrolimus kikuchii]